MKKILTIILAFLFVGVQAQIQHGGLPKSLKISALLANAPMVSTPETNLLALQQEDEVVDQIKDIPWRYGYIHYMDISMEDGVFNELPNGDRIWRISIESPGAQTINFTFDQYQLAKGAQVFIYTSNYERVLGAFTHENNKEHGFLTTTLIESDHATIELYEPKVLIGQSQLHIQRVVHGYRSLDFKQKYIGDSGACNNNVICPEGDNWRDQIRSVGILLNQNTLNAGFCTGALINNACNDEIPYFLTANHCGADDPTTLVGFNFESTTCNSNNGPYMNNTVSGVSLRASNAGSDVMLLELSSLPPASYNVFYSGWDRSGVIGAGQVGIHHPRGDVKKISFDMESAVQATYSGAQCWRVLDWEDGTTEGGSSGSPLYNLDGNIIGQLYGGAANCGNNIDDYYGRFDISWDNGSVPGNELKTWLDVCNSGVIVVTGYDPNAITLNEDVALGFSGIPSGQVCGSKLGQVVTLRNRGTQDLISAQIKYGIDGVYETYNWNGLLTSNQTETISLDSLSLASGMYNYEAFIVITNLVTDEDLSNDTVRFPIDIVDGVDVVINLTTNFAGSENSIIIEDEDGNVIEFEDNFGNTQTYNLEYCLPTSRYCITIDDSGVNGLSPTFFVDQGNYQLLVDGVEIYNGDDIGDSYEYCFGVSNPTGIKDALNEIDLSIFPNPTTSGFTIQTSEEIQQVQLYDILGALVYDHAVFGNQLFVNTEDLAKGFFVVKVFTNNGTGIDRVLVK